MDADLVDLIYEAAFVPDLWAGLLEQVAERTSSAAGAVVVFGENTPPRFAASPRIDGVLRAFIDDNRWERSEVIKYVVSVPPACFVYDADYFPTDLLETADLRREMTAPLGMGGQIGSFVSVPTGDMAIFTFERWLENDRPALADLHLLNGLRPHLARAGMLSARLRMEQARAGVAALEVIGLPAAVLTRRGRVTVANGLFETAGITTRARDCIALDNTAANTLLTEAIENAHSHDGKTVRSVPVAGDGERAPMVMHLLPLRRAAHELFSGGDILLVVTAVTADALIPSLGILHGLFDLSPAEARLAMALSRGQSLKDAATAQGIQVSSARSYLERIFQKTATHQQSELVALLKTAALPGQTGPAT